MLKWYLNVIYCVSQTFSLRENVLLKLSIEIICCLVSQTFSLRENVLLRVSPYGETCVFQLSQLYVEQIRYVFRIICCLVFAQVVFNANIFPWGKCFAQVVFKYYLLCFANIFPSGKCFAQVVFKCYSLCFANIFPSGKCFAQSVF